MTDAGIIGLHLVSGPLVGVAIGYALDYFFGIAPWGKLIFFFIGILAGFLNVWRDSKELIKQLEKENSEKFRMDVKK